MADNWAKKAAYWAKLGRKDKYPYGMMNTPLRVSNGSLTLSKGFAAVNGGAGS